MRTFITSVLLAGLLASCIQNSSTKLAGEKTRKEVVSSVEGYLKNKLKDPHISVDSDGMISVSDVESGFGFNPSKIILGEIDENAGTDAIVPMYVFRGRSFMGFEHLILLHSGETFVVVKTMNNILNVIEIKDRKIIAEVSTVSPDSPGFGCDQCREVVQYRYRDGDLERVE